MARLVVVSNRVPNPADIAAPLAGGLVVALAEALVPGSLWFGWSGRVVENATNQPRSTEAHGITYATIDLEEAAYRDFYLGFSNGTLWPLFHMITGFTVFERSQYAVYHRVNERYAEALVPLLQPDDMIWIHDYQLLSVAAALRERGVTNRIGFFLHIPFPAPALFEILPPALELLENMLAHDVIGFQTVRDKAHFLDAVNVMLGFPADANGVIDHGGHIIQAIVTPVGIDTDAFTALAFRASRRVTTKRMIDSLAGRPLMVGIDRLDYTKGLPSRFDAYARFLAKHPELHRQISYLQVAAPSREEVDRYAALRDELNHKTGAINGAYSDFDWVPLRYMTRTVSRSLIAGFYRTARICLVTPLRDGMNLVAKEYVAAQNPETPGVLVLSRFAGAADSMDEALLVNPFDIDAVADAIANALIMPLEERQARHAALLLRVRTESAAAYCRAFTTTLAG